MEKGIFCTSFFQRKNTENNTARFRVNLDVDTETGPEWNKIMDVEDYMGKDLDTGSHSSRCRVRGGPGNGSRENLRGKEGVRLFAQYCKYDIL